MTANIRTWIAAGLLLVVCGCAEKLTYERWETIHEGASKDVVEATLGDPFQQTDETWVYQDSDRGITAMIYFEDNEVIGTKWADSEHGMKGKSPHVNEPGEREEIKTQKIE